MPDPFACESGVTVGELIKQLQMQNEGDWVCFGPHGYFTFHRVKDRGGVAQIEFNEIPGSDFDISPEHPYSQHCKRIGLV